MEVKTEEVEVLKVEEPAGEYSVAVAGELEPRSVMGRPTKYEGQATLDKTAEYVDGGFKDRGEVLPSAAGLARYLGVSKKTLYNWAEEHVDFLHTLDALNTEQERVVLSGGLSGQFAPTITRVVLNNHGYTDKQQVEHSASNGAAGGFAITWGNSNASG
jgi:hypothetical protein